MRTLWTIVRHPIASARLWRDVYRATRNRGA